jgi:hypothetical protein
MKRVFLAAFAIALGFVSLSWGADQSYPRLITVTGDAEVRVVPDEVVIILGIETSNMILKTAKDMNDRAVRGVIAVAKNSGVDNKNVQTDYFTIEPKYEYISQSGPNYGKTMFTGYFVRKNVVITLKDLSKYEDLLSGVLEAGANYVTGIQFLTTDLRKYRDQARVMAIDAAKEKAGLFAGKLGLNLGKAYSINEDYSDWNTGNQQNMIQNASRNMEGGGSPQGTATISPGEISVTARVTVSFELQ